MHMQPVMFREVLDRVGHLISKKDTRWQDALEPGLKLAITLRHLATGESYENLCFSFRIAHNTISLIVRDVCEAIIEEYADEVVKLPTTSDEWRDVAEKFGLRWNFHHALGAMDGKHISIRNSKNGESLYYNYKGYYSIIMLTLVDGNYKFLWVDGANGATSDCSIFNQSRLKTALKNEDLGFPEPEPLPADDCDMPYFFIRDDAFPL